MSDILPPLGPPSAAELERETKRAVDEAKAKVRSLKTKDPQLLAVHTLASLHANLYLLTRAADWRKAKFAEIDARLAALEAGGIEQLARAYQGTWRGGATYRPGSLVTDKGSLWIAKAETAERPGTEAWQLCAKGGKLRLNGDGGSR